MLKYGGFNPETARPVLGIGLSRENCRRLLAGEPIVFDTSGFKDLPEIEVVIMGGETEEAMAFDMIKAGASPEAFTRDDPGEPS